jgi:hypothetical protein
MKAHTMGTRMIALALAGTVLAGPVFSTQALAAAKKPAAAAPATPPAPPALTRDEARAHAAEIFDKLDFNHDGVFNAADFKARRDARLSEMFDRLDVNHDGSLTKAEFIAGHDHHPEGPDGGPGHEPKDGPGHGPGGDMPPPPPGGPRGPGPHGPHREGPMGHERGPGMMAFSPMVFEILHEADPQHTGSVTKDAFIAAELKRFDEADTNHDGKVTREEMRASRHEHQRGRWHDGGRDRDDRFGHHDEDAAPPPPPAAPATK